MLSSMRTSLARSGASPAVRVASRRMAVPRARLQRAGYATDAQAAVKASEGGAGGSHLAAGVAGGLAVLLGGYATYRASGLHGYVQTAQQTSAYLSEARDRVSSSVSATLEKTGGAADALRYLRGVAKSYAGIIPGAGTYIDTMFDELDMIADKHGDEAAKIANGAYEDIQALYGETKSKGTVDVATAAKVADVLRRKLEELYALGKKAGGDVVQQYLDAHPDVKEKLGGGYDQLVKIAQDKGPEAQKMIQDVQKQVKEIFAKGATPEALLQARELVQSKADELRRMAEPAAREAWDKSLQQAQPYLNKLPEIKDLLDSKAAAFLGVGAGALGGRTQEIWDRLKAAAEATGDERKKQVDALKGFVEEKAKEAQNSVGSVTGVGMDDILGYVKKIPGGEEALKKVPNLQALIELSKSRGDDASKLAKETWDDVLKVLNSKAEKAKELAEGAKDDAKKASEKDDSKKSGEKDDSKKSSEKK